MGILLGLLLVGGVLWFIYQVMNEEASKTVVAGRPSHKPRLRIRRVLRVRWVAGEHCDTCRCELVLDEGATE